MATLTIIFIYLQLILGAAVRHTESNPAVVLHIVNALLVVIHIFLLVKRIVYNHGHDRILNRAALTLGLLTLFQIFLGIGSFIFTRILEKGYAPSFARVVTTAAHQTTGALILGCAFLIFLKVRK